MKKLVLCLIALVIGFSINAQIQTPAPSPYSKIEQKVGLTDVSIEYSRPSKKGRTIYGDLVPYGKIWRTGANARTTISFSDDVKIGDANLEAGTYAIFTIPEQDKWEFIFYTDYAGGGAPQSLDETKVAARINVIPAQMPFEVETFSIMVGDLTNNSASLGLIWSNTYAGFTIEVPTESKVTSQIEKIMAGPGAGDYYASAVYYMTEGKDLKKANDWMNKAMSMTEKPAFWQLRQQSLLYAKMGDKKAAIETAKKSLEGAKAAKNDDYIKMNMDSLKEWGAM